MTRVILVHGFNVRDDGEGSVARLRPYFERLGCQVKVAPYGFFFLFGVRWGNRKIAKMLAAMAEPGDIVVGHSNGYAIAHAAAKLGAPFGGMIAINPALDDDAQLPAHIPFLHVWHSPSDTPVRWAKWLPLHAWGDMGADGYQGPPDDRITNFNKECDFVVSSRAHSDVFKEPLLSFFGPLIAEKAVAAADSKILAA